MYTELRIPNFPVSLNQIKQQLLLPLAFIIDSSLTFVLFVTAFSWMKSQANTYYMWHILYKN